MDSFTRRYLYLLGGVLTVVLVSWLAGRVKELNAQLAGDQLLAEYPYKFRLLEIENREAVMSSPRSAQLSVMLQAR